MSRTYTPTPELLALRSDPVSTTDLDEWAAELESGKYKQDTSHGKLQWRESFCCMGVLGKSKGIDMSSMGGCLAVQNKLIGDLNGNGVFSLKAANGGGIDLCFYELNDLDKLTFPEIAQILRGNPVEKS